MTVDRLLQYFGLRQTPGTERTTADRVWTWSMVVVLVVTLFLTRNLDFWPQVGVLVALSVVLGAVGGTILTSIAARRTHSTDE